MGRKSGHRAAIIVLDSVGIGSLPDAAAYGDEGCNTVGNIARALGGLSLPNLERLGLGNLVDAPGIRPLSNSTGAYGRMREASAGKDTTTGHWELSGIILDHPFPVYPDGFPADVIDRFATEIGRSVIGNKAASGTEIINELGDEHVRTGCPIVYTSADSVFQVAAHENVIPVNELYRICAIARDILVGEHAVGRVIARPFLGANGGYMRTGNRRDFSLQPAGKTLLDAVSEGGGQVFGIGKIEDIFAHRGLTGSNHTTNNAAGMNAVLAWLQGEEAGLAFANLVDFDMLYGHRNDVPGYAQALRDFDAFIPQIEAALTTGDIVIVTADHGCDPTTPGTDHTREYVPVLAFGPGVKGGVSIGERQCFADVGATVAEWLGAGKLAHGQSFLGDIMKVGA